MAVSEVGVKFKAPKSRIRTGNESKLGKCMSRPVLLLVNSCVAWVMLLASLGLSFPCPRVFGPLSSS